MKNRNNNSFIIKNNFDDVIYEDIILSENIKS
jgi:hypothetical protein